jgi:hypothetical protein
MGRGVQWWKTSYYRSSSLSFFFLLFFFYYVFVLAYHMHTKCLLRDKTKRRDSYKHTYFVFLYIERNIKTIDPSLLCIDWWCTFHFYPFDINYQFLSLLTNMYVCVCIHIKILYEYIYKLLFFFSFFFFFLFFSSS